ncbi:MAG: Ni/Fe hydrogenase subunit alpha [Pseudomonadota bacterium]
MPTMTFPISRIEGHAQAVIEIRKGLAAKAYFQATEFRGFERFIQGTPAEEVIVIVPRICGVCATAHHLAAVKALEGLYAVTPPPLALKIRELLMLGQMIQSQATSLFLFTMPDELGTESMMPAEASTPADRAAADLAQHALRIRKIGTALIELAGGQFIHPVNAVIGGVTHGIAPGDAAAMHARIQATLPTACALFDEYIEQAMALRERIGTWGDDTPAAYISAVADHRPDYTGKSLRVMGVDGAEAAAFAARDYAAYLTLEDTDYSYAGRMTFRGGLMRANSLARINLAKSIGTPLADGYLAHFRNTFGNPAHAILLFDQARGIELVYGLERALEILAEPLDDNDTKTSYTPRDGEAFGLVEAPRGPLIHHYVIEKGLIAKARFIIPTVFNVGAIEHALKVAARRYITGDGVNMELEHAVGRVVRAFDPCIACATH